MYCGINMPFRQREETWIVTGADMTVSTLFHR